MAVTTQNPPDVDLDEARLANDERWLLVARILASEGFQRAGQLRKILLYVSRSAILNPERVFHEYEIACDVLDRRPDFDPANDNIVRAQVSHLRRKLDKYFSEDNPAEPILLTIPRGSYIPQFLSNPLVHPGTIDEPDLGTSVTAPMQPDGIQATEPGFKTIIPWWRTWTGVGFIFCALACLVLAIVLGLAHREAGPPATQNPVPANGFIPFLARGEGSVSVVLPDTSESMIQFISGVDISAADYSSKEFPQQQIAAVQDPEVRKVLSQLAQKRNTTVSEAAMGFNFVDALKRAGGRASVRYARDIHVRDFDDGSTILIGTQTSNPWVLLFSSRTNFQYVRNPADNQFCFLNVKPLTGEDRVYAVSLKVTPDQVNYVDIAFLPNPLQSGYILLIVGSDLAANEAAGNLILHGKLPPSVMSLLNGKDQRSFEIFLRGRHISGDSEDALEVLSVRTDADMPVQGTKVNR